MKRVRIIYLKGNDGNIDEDFYLESLGMSRRGFRVGTHPFSTDEHLIYRGPTIRIPDKYPKDIRFINDWEANRRTQFLSLHYHLIEPNTIPTFFMQDLTEKNLIEKIHERGWNKVFIRSDSKSLYFDDIKKCIWPLSSLDEISKNYDNYNLNGPFAIREFIEDDIFYDEQRYWVLNGHPYHPSGRITEMVKKVASEIFYFSRSRYFTLNVAGDYIVEINPGESSDRGCENPLDFFCDIFAHEFL